MEGTSLEGQIVALQAVVALLVHKVIRADDEMVEARELVVASMEAFYEGRRISGERHHALQIGIEFVEQLLAPSDAQPKPDRE